MHNKTEQPYKYVLKPLEKGPNYWTVTTREFLLRASTKVDAITKALDRHIEEFHAREKRTD